MPMSSYVRRKTSTRRTDQGDLTDAAISAEVIESARLICEAVQIHGEKEPCGNCIQTASELNARFVERIPKYLMRLPGDQLSAAIRRVGVVRFHS
jgi:hypothetical protein